jgi:hypothetical protein
MSLNPRQLAFADEYIITKEVFLDMEEVFRYAQKKSSSEVF